MAPIERLIFGFAYHRVGRTDLWRSGGSTLGRIGWSAEHPERGVRLAQHGDRIVWIDVVVDCSPDEDLNDISRACEDWADAEFCRLYPHAELVCPR
jgi:hypothetical protein